jgi:hypothetical protein
MICQEEEMMKGSKRFSVGIAITALVAGMAFQMAPAAVAKDGEIIRTGDCSGTTNWKLKVAPDDGEKWRVVMKDNGDRFFKGVRQTKGPSGSFSVETFTQDKAGSDKILARAVNLRTSETCTGTIAI